MVGGRSGGGFERSGERKNADDVGSMDAKEGGDNRYRKFQVEEETKEAEEIGAIKSE